MRLDRISGRMIDELQRDAMLPLAQLADRVGLTQTPCWKGAQKLVDAGMITGRVASVDPRKVSLSLTASRSVAAPDQEST